MPATSEFHLTNSVQFVTQACHSYLSPRQSFHEVCTTILCLQCATCPRGVQLCILDRYPDSKDHGAYMGSTWGRQDPGGPHVGPMNLAIRVGTSTELNLDGIMTLTSRKCSCNYLKLVIAKLILRVNILSISFEGEHHRTYFMIILYQIGLWLLSTSHYLNQCWPSLMSL